MIRSSCRLRHCTRDNRRDYNSRIINVLIIIMRHLLTLVLYLALNDSQMLALKDTARTASRAAGASAVPARGLARRARAAPGITRSGTTAGVRGAASGLGQEGAGNARLANCGSPRPRKPGLELSRHGDNRPARVAMERREASASRLWTRAAPEARTRGNARCAWRGS
jgi:hypothetical protein